MAMTRARKGLTLLHTAKASRKRELPPSPFLRELPAEFCVAAAACASAAVAEQLRELDAAAESDCGEGPPLPGVRAAART